MRSEVVICYMIMIARAGARKTCGGCRVVIWIAVHRMRRIRKREGSNGCTELVAVSCPLAGNANIAGHEPVQLGLRFQLGDFEQMHEIAQIRRPARMLSQFPDRFMDIFEIVLPASARHRAPRQDFSASLSLRTPAKPLYANASIPYSGCETMRREACV
jgi:hypothetical protein